PLHAPAPTVIDTLSLHDALPICSYLRKGFQNRPDIDENDSRAGFESKNAGPGRLVFHQHPWESRRRSAGRSGKFQDKRRIETFRSEEHTSELQSRENLVCRLLLE